MKNAIIAVLAVVILGVGGWFYLTELHTTEIGKIVSNPRDYAGRELIISGRVTERFSFFVLKYFLLQDSTGQIPVISDKPLPTVGAEIRVKGHIEEGFSLGGNQVLVFLEKSLSSS